MTIKDIGNTLAQIPSVVALARQLKPRPGSTADCFAARVESLAQRYGDRSAVVSEGQELSLSLIHI